MTVSRALPSRDGLCTQRSLGECSLNSVESPSDADPIVILPPDKKKSIVFLINTQNSIAQKIQVGNWNPFSTLSCFSFALFFGLSQIVDSFQEGLMGDAASSSGCGFYKVLCTGSIGHFEHLQNTSLPHSDLDQRDCGRHWNVSHLKGFESRWHLKRVKSHLVKSWMPCDF